MLLSELIQRLQFLYANYGDRPVILLRDATEITEAAISGDDLQAEREGFRKASVLIIGEDW